MTFLQSWKESLLIFAPRNLKKFVTDFIAIFLGTCKRLPRCWFWLLIGMVIASYYIDNKAAKTIFDLLLFVFMLAVDFSAYQSFAKRAFTSIKQALPVLGKFLIIQAILMLVLGIVLAITVAPLIDYFIGSEQTLMQYEQTISSIDVILIILKGTSSIGAFFAFYFFDSDRRFGSWFKCLIKAIKTTFLYYPACWLLGIVTLLDVYLLGLTNLSYLQLKPIISIPISTSLYAALYKWITKQ